jgi:hypothetical protein
MTCEDGDEKDGETVVETRARQIASLLAAGPIRAVVRLLPPGVRRAVTTVLVTATNVFRA